MADYGNIECDGAYENIPTAGGMYFTSPNNYATKDHNITENGIQSVKELESRVQVLEGLLDAYTNVTDTKKRTPANIEKNHSLPNQVSRASFVTSPTGMTASRCQIAIALLILFLIAGLAGNLYFLYLKKHDGNLLFS